MNKTITMNAKNRVIDFKVSYLQVNIETGELKSIDVTCIRK